MKIQLIPHLSLCNSMNLEGLHSSLVALLPMCDDHHVLNPLRPTMTSKKGPNIRKIMCLGLYHLMNSLLTCRVEIKAIKMSNQD
jgi:hypothetical protein